MTPKARLRVPALGPRSTWLAIAALFVGGSLAVWGLLTFFPADPADDPAPEGAAAASAVPATTASASPTLPPANGRTIRARMFYVGSQGTRLVGVERDVPFADNLEGQARAIIEAQIAPPPEDQLSPIPDGTAVRAVFVTPKGEAYVDLTRPVTDAHPGGTTNELLTVYAIVNALTTNLPSVTSVQILVDGREVDTLAGHVDLRRPLAQNLDWVQ